MSAGDNSAAPDLQAVTDDAPKRGSAWSRFHGRINGLADNFFYRLGFWVAHHAKQ
ncbi:unnamed protein product, partial [Scytosiphon promiscuus]